MLMREGALVGFVEGDGVSGDAPERPPRQRVVGGERHRPAPDQERRLGRCEWLIGHIIAVSSRFVRVSLGGICNAREGRRCDR